MGGEAEKKIGRADEDRRTRDDRNKDKGREK